MKRVIKTVALGVVLTSSSMYAAGVSACTGCHGQFFEKAALGKSKIVKDMSQKEIEDALKGYKAGTYGGSMKQLMVGQVGSLSDADITQIAQLIKADPGVADDKATEFAADAAADASGGGLIDLNKDASREDRIKKEDLGNKDTVSEEVLGLRQTDIYKEGSDTKPVKTDYSRPAPGSSKKFERAYKNAPPMIPHSVDGLLPITANNNQCLGCHMPDVAKSTGATPIPPTHFTNYRPTTVYKDGELVKEGKTVGPNGELKNTSDIKIAKAKKSDKLYQGRFNCSQCHAPQSKAETAVGNTFRPDGLTEEFKSHSSLADAMNEGVK